MISKLIENLSNHPKVDDWMIHQTQTESLQAFYVMRKLETIREEQTSEIKVTVYHRFKEDNVDYMGSSSFLINHPLSDSELTEFIETSLFSASFSKNKPFNLVKGLSNKQFQEPPLTDDPLTLLEKIADVFNGEANKASQFNALELFHNKKTTRILNSQNVDLSKTLYQVEVEAIPTYDGKDQSVELYQYYTYKAINFDAIKNDAVNALKEVESRYNAKTLPPLKNIDILLKNSDVKMFFRELISLYDFSQLYSGATNKKIGDWIQPTILKDAINITLRPSTDANAFDDDGVMLLPTQIIQNGQLKQFYGSNQYAQYTNNEPTGHFDLLEATPGKTTYTQLTDEPYIEILALSGLQMDVYSNYIGGEVRLAHYFDGQKTVPVSGFSFSGKIDEILKTLQLSKELTTIKGYHGPKYIKLPLLNTL